MDITLSLGKFQSNFNQAKAAVFDIVCATTAPPSFKFQGREYTTKQFLQVQFSDKNLELILGKLQTQALLDESVKFYNNDEGRETDKHPQLAQRFLILYLTLLKVCYLYPNEKLFIEAEKVLRKLLYALPNQISRWCVEVTLFSVALLVKNKLDGVITVIGKLGELNHPELKLILRAALEVEIGYLLMKGSLVKRFGGLSDSQKKVFSKIKTQLARFSEEQPSQASGLEAKEGQGVAPHKLLSEGELGDESDEEFYDCPFGDESDNEDEGCEDFHDCLPPENFSSSQRGSQAPEEKAAESTPVKAERLSVKKFSAFFLPKEFEQDLIRLATLSVNQASSWNEKVADRITACEVISKLLNAVYNRASTEERKGRLFAWKESIDKQKAEYERLQKGVPQEETLSRIDQTVFRLTTDSVSALEQTTFYFDCSRNALEKIGQVLANLFNLIKLIFQQSSLYKSKRVASYTLSIFGTACRQEVAGSQFESAVLVPPT